MRAAGIKTLKNRLSEYVRLAEAGEHVLVTDRDRVVSRLGAPPPRRTEPVSDALLAQAVRDGLITPPVRFPTCQPAALAAPLREGGLGSIATCTLDVPTTFADFQDCWSPFLGGQGPAPGYCMGLSEAQRAALRERLRASLPFELDGRISSSARAWAVRGVVPAA